jgi:hypothetical protein
VENVLFVHVRFDGCIIKDLPQKRCDCVIFRFEPNVSKPVMYAIETKEDNPDLSEVQAQIQCCLDVMQAILQSNSDVLRVVPVLCASAFHGLDFRAFFAYRVVVFGRKTMIERRLYGQDINEL